MLTQDLKDFFPMFPSRSFINLELIFMSVIHLRLIFIYDIFLYIQASCRFFTDWVTREALWSKAVAPNLSSTSKTIFPQIFWFVGGREMVSGWLKCITFIVTLFLLLLHQFHLRSPGIRTQRVETPVLRYISKFIFLVYEHPIISALFVEKLTTLTDLPLHFCINKKSLLIYIRV